MSKSITIIIPAFNEEESIGQVITEIKNVLTKVGHDIPILVVDDGSMDKTSDIAKSNGVSVIRHDENRGYGASLKTGIRHADTEFVLIMDGDGTYPAHVLPQLIDYSETYDMVVGARNWSPPSRVFAKWILKKIANYLAETKIPDLNSGMRLMRKSVIERYLPILPNGFSFTTTITLAMLCNGYAVKYISIDYRKRSGQSKIQPIRNTWEFIILIIRTIVYFNPLRVFLPVGLLCILFGIFIGLYSKFIIGRLMDVTTITTITSGIEIMMIGFLADLIAKRTK